MKNNFFTEVVILLLPPLFNRINFEHKKFYFLGLNEISGSKILFSSLDSSKKKDIYAFAKDITSEDFGSDIAELIRKKIEDKQENSFQNQENQEENNNSDDLKVILVNYPMSSVHFDSLIENLQNIGTKISKIIISNSVPFESLLEIKSKCFICPICFKSYEKEPNFINDEYVCPLDGEKFDSSQMNQFINFFTEKYLHDSLEVIQKFASNNNGKNMFALNVDDNEIEVQKNLLKILNSVVE